MQSTMYDKLLLLCFKDYAKKTLPLYWKKLDCIFRSIQPEAAL